MFDKQKIKLQCIDLVSAKVDVVQNELAEIQDAIRNETKSSVGDKHETSRAMAQNEQERLNGQMEELIRQQRTIKGISTSESHGTVQLGSCVQTSAGNFFMAIGLGAISVGDEKIYVIAPNSPVGRNLMGTCVGEAFMTGQEQATVLFIS